MSDIIKTQSSLATKAKHNPQHQFDHLYRLICREDWIHAALKSVLSNQGAKTAGIDGVTKKELASVTAQAEFVSELRLLLQTKQFRPTPVRRVYIPKASGKRRPLGIATLKDRVVQMLLKMVLEPIWESDFLNCSNGFRPGRRTQDCIALLDSYINKRNKYYWVIEGDIKGAFDNIHHEILLKLVAQRVADPNLLKLVERFLTAGVMEGALFRRTEIGTPQGAVCSPLFANIYLHQLDLHWWNKYGNLDRKQKEKRRTQHLGNCALIRYADDWLLLTNGDKAEAYRLRDEFQAFLKQELKLELNIEKTRVTHVNNGFDFLGFHVQRYVSAHDKPKLLVTPTEEAKFRLKSKIKEMTDRKYYQDSPLLKFTAINAVLRGWIGYYCHCNAKETAKDLDYWVNERLFLWLQKRHRLPPRRIIKMYKMRQNGTRDNWGIRNGEDYLYLYRMSDKPITKYRSRSLPNPYLEGEWSTALTTPNVPISDHVWLGNADNEHWRELKEEILAERGAKCAACGSTEQLDLHHIKPLRIGGQDVKENLQILCRHCHTLTPSFGDHRRLQ
ncbi:MAG: group II intron reverse transcriptase/maturase [Stigonema ocellatum SAG 48.90 = DSM 106950]|nr:group II intron reverse transcriptase/maturase [Stigonema ocellatum SAG 48.90 = DSM 106950]